MSPGDSSSSAHNLHALGSELLQSAVDKLAERSRQRLQGEQGLSSEFTEKATHPELVTALCERAMDNLADHYVYHLEKFQTVTEPLQALHHLEEAEVVWRSEAAIIQQFDKKGSEVRFLSQMRDQSLRVLENRLEEVAGQHETVVSPERIALTVGIIAIMDQIFSERGEAVDSPHRSRMRSIARSLVR